MSDKKNLKVVPGGKQETGAEGQAASRPVGPVLGGSPLMSGKPADPNLTLDVKNEKVEELLKVYAEDKTVDNLNALIDAIRRARVLVPAEVKENNQPFPCAIRNNNGETFLPLYTSKEQIPKEPKSQAILNMPFLAINNMALHIQPVADGIVINPFSNNMVFKRPLVEKIDENERKRLEAMQRAKENGTTIDTAKPKEIKLSPEQYVIFERSQFEMVFLPSKLFNEKAELMDKISNEKEEYIEAIYEESYQQKRLYPYIAEDFSVMSMHISEEFSIIRIDMPTRDMQAGSCFRVYLTYNSATDTCRYFTIEKGMDASNKLAEVNEAHKHIVYGDAPVEGAELQMIIDMTNDEGAEGITS